MSSNYAIEHRPDRVAPQVERQRYITAAEVGRTCEVLRLPDLQPPLSVPANAERGVPASPAVRAKLLMLIEFMWRSGCRISEALAVCPRDVDTHLGLVHVRTLKRQQAGLTRTLPMPPDLLSRLSTACHPDTRVWSWDRSYAGAMITLALVAAGVPRQRARPHALRHGHAIHALRNGAPLETVQRALGHSSVVTTAIYLRATGEDVRRAYASITW